MPDHSTTASTSEPLNGKSLFAATMFRRGVLTVRLAGPSVGEREAPIIANQIQRAIDAAGKTLRSLVLDMSDVQVISSMGLGMCIDVRHQVAKLRAESIVYGLNSQLSELFHMMKVDRLFTMVGDEVELDRAVGV